MATRRAQNTVEMALLLPILVLLVAIGLDFARIYHMAAVVANSARVAAEYGATHYYADPSRFVAGSATPTARDIIDMAVQEGAPYVTPGSVTVQFYARGSGPTDPYGTWTGTGPFTAQPADGQPLKVRVQVTFYPITPMARAFMPSGQTVTGVAHLRRTCATVTGSDTTVNCTSRAPIP